MFSKRRIPQMIKYNFIKNRIGLTLYENALVLPKILKKFKKYNLFSKKINYIKARSVIKNSFGFEKRSHTFLAFLANKSKKKMPKVKAIYSLLLLALKVKNLSKKILKAFSGKFVGKEARLLVKQYLDTYISMYTFWYENEKWGFFDEDLTEKTKLRLMKYFWLNKSRRFLRQKLWKRAYPLNNFSFRYVKRSGYNMKSLKVTDHLFFWHAFTRKKLKQTPWIFRTSNIFRKILCLKKKEILINNFKYKKDSSVFQKIYRFFFSLHIQIPGSKSAFFDADFLMKAVPIKFGSKLPTFTVLNLKNHKNYCILMLFFLSSIFKKNGVTFFKNLVVKSYIYFLIFNYFVNVNYFKNNYLSYFGNRFSLYLFLKKN